VCRVNVENFELQWQAWYQSNAEYIEPVILCQQIMHDLVWGQTEDLSGMTDIWTQAVLYYYIWLEYGIEVPHNDFADFFSNTDQIKKLVQ
jgi:hypothetical protein